MTIIIITICLNDLTNGFLCNSSQSKLLNLIMKSLFSNRLILSEIKIAYVRGSFVMVKDKLLKRYNISPQFHYFIKKYLNFFCDTFSFPDNGKMSSMLWYSQRSFFQLIFVLTVNLIFKIAAAAIYRNKIPG